MKAHALTAVALSLFVSSVWCFATRRTSLAAWRVPVEYSADAWYTLATLRAAQDGHLTPFGGIEVPELGAPPGASWNGFLRQHKPQYWLAGRLSRTLGLFATGNLLVLLATVLAALSFHAVARYFCARWEWAFAGACAFALSPFLFYRSLSHLTLAFYWPVPLAILVVSWAFGRRGVPAGSRRFWLSALIVLVTGLHNIYFAALLAQFLGLAGLTQWLLRRVPRAALGALGLLAILLFTVAADNANLLLQHASEGASAPLLRPYGNLERYALKPIELLLPIGGNAIVPWRAAGTEYQRAALLRGELGSAYLGLAGVASLLALAVVAGRAALLRPRRPVPAAAAAVAWVVAYSVVGGVNGLLGLSGFVWLRATNRSSIWILALVLLWVVLAISRTPLARRRTASVIAAVLALALTLADQLPPRTRSGAIRELGVQMASDVSLCQALEATLPADAMLFQLPVVDFPEGPRVLAAGDYEHLRPYLHSTRLRFSYGSDKGDPRDAWQARAAALEPEPLAQALERVGFSGLLVNRKAYADGARELRERLAASGRVEAWESPDHDFLFVRLRPVPSPEAPDAVIPKANDPGGQAP